MSSPQPEIVIRGSWFSLVAGVLLMLNTPMMLAAGRGWFGTALGVLWFGMGVYYCARYFVDHVTVTPDEVNTRSGFIKRSFWSDDALRTVNAGRQLYIGRKRFKLPFPMKAEILHECVRRTRGLTPTKLPRQWFGGGRIVRSQLPLRSTSDTIDAIARRSMRQPSLDS
jgi:hypothetical protein